jgi:RES domain
MFFAKDRSPNSEQPPGTHPNPPDKLPEILPIYTIARGTELFRVHLAQYGAIHFSGLKAEESNTRFRSPSQEYGTMYLATDLFGAFRETIGAMSSYRLVSESNLSSRCLSIVTADLDLDLADISGAGLTWIGADSRLTTGSYSVAQAWAKALWQHSRHVDGLYYRSRYDPSRLCIVLFSDRVDPESLSAKPINQNFLEDSFVNQLIEILNEYNYTIGSDLNPTGE